jgi:hypothetical protein
VTEAYSVAVLQRENRFNKKKMLEANVVTANELTMTVWKPAAFPAAILRALSSKNTCHMDARRASSLTMIAMDRRNIWKKNQ